MKSIDLCNQMENDFRLSICSDNWSEMDMNEYVTNQYRERYMGLISDNSDSINYAYTAVFPSKIVLEKIVADNRREALLFLHHPMQWVMPDIPVFTDIPKDYLRKLKERNISIYNLHVPLDANGEFGTTYNFAKAVGIGMTDEFYEYHGVNVGIIGTTECQTITLLMQRFESAVGHEVVLYPYGAETIKDNRVALVAGGGNDAAVYPGLRERGINTYLTGIMNMKTGYQPSIDGHNSAKENGINVLAGTHYSTEKFACMKMVEYFSRLGISGEFIPDIPCLDDM